MNEFEAASFYGDFSILREMYADILSENFEDATPAENFEVEVTE